MPGTRNLPVNNVFHSVSFLYLDFAIVDSFSSSGRDCDWISQIPFGRESFVCVSFLLSSAVMQRHTEPNTLYQERVYVEYACLEL